MSLVLLHSPADILRWALVERGELGRPAELWPAFVSQEPSSPDNCVTLYDTGQKGDGRAMYSGEAYNHYNVQLRVRATDPKTCYAKADEIKRFMDEGVYIESVAIDSAVYTIQAVCKTNLAVLGKDSATKRNLATVNCTLALQRVT